MQHFKLLWVDLWFFLQVVSIILYVLLAMTFRKMTTALIVIIFVFSLWCIRLIILFSLWLFFILLLLFIWLRLLLILFNALIEQVLIDHHNLFDWLVAVTLLLTRIVNDQPLFMGEKARWVQFTTLTPFVGSIEGGTRTVSFPLGCSNARRERAVIWSYWGSTNSPWEKKNSGLSGWICDWRLWARKRSAC